MVFVTAASDVIPVEQFPQNVTVLKLDQNVTDVTTVTIHTSGKKSKFQLISSVQGGIYALGNVHVRSPPSVGIFPSVAI